MALKRKALFSNWWDWGAAEREAPRHRNAARSADTTCPRMSFVQLGGRLISSSFFWKQTLKSFSPGCFSCADIHTLFHTFAVSNNTCCSVITSCCFRGQAVSLLLQYQRGGTGLLTLMPISRVILGSNVLGKYKLFGIFWFQFYVISSYIPHEVGMHSSKRRHQRIVKLGKSRRKKPVC